MSNNRTKSPAKKVAIVLALMTVAFVGAQNFATAQDKPTPNASAYQSSALSTEGSDASSNAGGGDGCCGGSGETVEGATTVTDSVQTIDIDTSTGSFTPNVVKAKAGLPIEINFSQASGGCLSGVLFADFGIDEDLTAGPKTISLPALEPGTYTFTCQMQMVSAQLVVE